jgi:hypothetical protein
MADKVISSKVEIPFTGIAQMAKMAKSEFQEHPNLTEWYTTTPSDPQNIIQKYRAQLGKSLFY